MSKTSAADQMSNATPEQAKAGMDAWMEWSKQAGSAIVDLGTPLGEAKKLDKSGSLAAETMTSGYSVLQADSMDAVLEVLKGHPHLMMDGNSIEVHETMPMPGME